MLVCVFTVLSHQFSDSAQRAKAFGIWGVVFGIGLGFGPVIGAGVVVISLAVFIAVERRVPDPMFDFSIFGNRRFSGALLGSMGMNFSFWPLMVYLPLFFQHGLGYSSIATGLSVLAYTLPSLLLPPYGERLAVRFGPERVIPVGIFAMGSGLLLMAIGAGAENASWLTLLPGCVLAGSGLGVINTPITNTTTRSVPSDRAGMASGMDTSARFISLAINIAVVGLILVKGTAYALEASLPGFDPSQLRLLAEGLSAGTARLDELAATGQAVPPDVAQQSLLFGYRLAMAYAGACACVLAAVSALRFRGSRNSPASCTNEPNVL